MILFILLLPALAYDVPEPPQCVIDVCEAKVCTVETPEGTVYIDKKPHYKEGLRIECPLWLIDPT
jgi:hypothetical protein